MFQKLFSIVLVFSLFLRNTYAVAEIASPSGILISIGDSSTVIAKIISYGIGIASILWVIGMTWAGIQMILAAGDDEKVKKAKIMITYSIIWVLLAGLAYGIVKVVSFIQI